MWLLRVEDYELIDFVGSNIPPYGILSHTWGKGEVSFRDMKDDRATAECKEGFDKIRGCCTQAKAHELSYVWIDSCCIDKSSSAELSEAINSMYRWYSKSEICFVYLSDVSPDGLSPDSSNLEGEFSKSRWFTRGWTLQELLAPRSTVFFASSWVELARKSAGRTSDELIEKLHGITRIPKDVISGEHPIRAYCAAQRMSWASKRQTTRDEDMSYCLMGLFSVHMPILYGEGQTNAFKRLQEEIIKKSPDESIFAWRAARADSGLLADTPKDFLDSGDVHQRTLNIIDGHFRCSSMTSLGISMQTKLCGKRNSVTGMAIGASSMQETQERSAIVIILKPVSEPGPSLTHLYRRIYCNRFFSLQALDLLALNGWKFNGTIHVLEDSHLREIKWIRPSVEPGEGTVTAVEPQHSANGKKRRYAETTRDEDHYSREANKNAFADD